MGKGWIKRFCLDRLVFDRWGLIVSFVLLIGCNYEVRQTAGRQQNLAAAGALTSSADASAPATCTNRGAIQLCFCPDGTPRGSQICGSDGKLTPCVCADNTIISTLELCADPRFTTCAESHKIINSQLLPVSILFVMDRSASMDCNPPQYGQASEDCETYSVRRSSTLPTKWEIAVASLYQVLSRLMTNYETRLRAGLMLFSIDGVCGVTSNLNAGGVPLEPVDNSRIQLFSDVLSNTDPQGTTPLVGAMISAYRYLHEEAGGKCLAPPCGAPGNRFVILISDGADSCPNPSFENAPCGTNGVNSTTPCTDYLLQKAVKEALRVNIRTFVIGVPGSEPARGFLSELAFQGGTARFEGCVHNDPNGDPSDYCHYDITTTEDLAEDLKNALNAAAGKAIGCEFSTPASAVGSGPVNIQYRLDPSKDPVCVPFINAAGACNKAANGWQFALNDDGTTNKDKVVLCGNACEVAKNTPGIQVDVIVGCPTLL